jgi:hypothetical protein
MRPWRPSSEQSWSRPPETRCGLTRTLDSQQVESLGRAALTAQLVGEVGGRASRKGCRNRTGRFQREPWKVIPIQMKVATGGVFSVHWKYARIPGLVMAYVWNARSAENVEFYAMTWQVARGIAEALGWTRTASWKEGGGYGTTRPDHRGGSGMRLSRTVWDTAAGGACYSGKARGADSSADPHPLTAVAGLEVGGVDRDRLVLTEAAIVDDVGGVGGAEQGPVAARAAGRPVGAGLVVAAELQLPSGIVFCASVRSAAFSAGEPRGCFRSEAANCSREPRCRAAGIARRVLIASGRFCR